ncbi:Transcriptional repressor NF-X1 [Coemansia sp. RSA 1821]|nr:Transcriptional repressor NF-X1 [Coemansia sp. RSA 1821]
MSCPNNRLKMQRRSANKPSRNQKHKAKVRDNDHRGRKSGKNRGMVGGGRMFNGSLTHDNDVSDGNYDGAASYSRTESESQDLSSTLAKRLFNGSYECMICCDKVRPRHAIWHCDKCWAVFHIGCVKKWVKSCSGDPSNQWRCPGCQYGRAAEPAHYVCFCGAVRDPEPVRGCTPHSCGTNPCRQLCKKPRKGCGHPCKLFCHSPAMCDESKPCETMVNVSCGCGRMTAQKICGATASNGHSTSKLACNEVCKIAERNRRLALALNIKDRAETPLAGLVKASYSDELLQFTRTHLSWVRDIESKAASFIGEKNRLTLNFAPMKPPFRAFLHALGPFYGCRSRSVDYEPLRSVCWDRTGQATIPSISLSNAIQYTVVPQIVCSSRIHAKEDSDCDDSASLDLNVNVKSTPRNSAVDRLRRKVDFLVISDLRHGLVEEELREAIDQHVSSKAYFIRWMGEDRVEMYCNDSEAKNEYLQKWEAVLKSKLPLHGVAGMVKGMRAASDASATPTQQNNMDASAEMASKRSDTANSPATTSWNALAVADPATDVSDCSVPEDWESLDI